MQHKLFLPGINTIHLTYYEHFETHLSLPSAMVTFENILVSIQVLNV